LSLIYGESISCPCCAVRCCHLTEAKSEKMGLRHRNLFEKSGRLFFVTTSVQDRSPVFTSSPYYEILANSIDFVRKKYAFGVVAFVLMPSHIHLIAHFSDEPKLSEAMRDFKKFTSTKIRQQIEKDKRNRLLQKLRDNATGRRHHVFKLWQDRFDSLVMTNPQTLRTKIDYVHSNPVRAKLVERITDWQYSSAVYYYSNEQPSIEVEPVLL
jgi:putative transposase